MRHSRIVAALVPAALLLPSATPAQDGSSPSRNEFRAPQHSQSPGSGLSLQGPDGKDVLEVTKDGSRKVRAGEPFEYAVTVRLARSI